MTKRWVPKNDLSEKKQKMCNDQMICALKIRKISKEVLINKYKCALRTCSNKIPQIMESKNVVETILVSILVSRAFEHQLQLLNE